MRLPTGCQWYIYFFNCRFFGPHLVSGQPSSNHVHRTRIAIQVPFQDQCCHLGTNTKRWSTTRTLTDDVYIESYQRSTSAERGSTKFQSIFQLIFLSQYLLITQRKVENRENKAWERKNAANSIWWWVFRAIIWEIKERGTKNNSSKTCSLSYIHGCFLR